MTIKVLGISGSLRNARFGAGSEGLCQELKVLDTDEKIREYLKQQTKIRVEDFVAAGRDRNLKFDEIYDSLKSLRGDTGLSNSEAALAAGLWGALQEGADIGHLSLSTHFPPSGKIKKPNDLKNKILEADAILLSGPVYFGDRGSQVQAFIEFITANDDVHEHLRGKVYGGIAVGAKRNGGQETTLIYQLIDMVNLNMLGVGNSSETTSQYGGTAVGGDVGTLWKDDYGITTCIGTGQRVARVANYLSLADGHKMKSKLRLDIWLLQDDASHKGRELYKSWADRIAESDSHVEIRIRDFTEETVTRCIACDICPTDVGSREEYRCIITTKNDLFSNQHSEIIDVDAVLLAAYSPKDRHEISSVYQSFIERTRYWRRDNYILGDRLWAPFVISEVSANQNLHIRMLTSAARHHTVVHHPLIGVEFDDKVINFDDLVEQGKSFVENAKKVIVGRYLEGGREDIVYNPVGYSLSKEKNDQDKASGELQSSIKQNSKPAKRIKVFKNNLQ